MKKQRNKKRLTFEDRMLIQACLLKKMNITEIAVFLFCGYGGNADFVLLCRKTNPFACDLATNLILRSVVVE